ncbi:MAG TPA: GWxTD domain-containing protein [Vicinamibacteria bacterium]|nr:GWxTD domain-containing protein [Vicinamibacteria bacterium]
MSLRPRLALPLAALLLAPAAAHAQKLDKEEKRWLEDVRPIMLPSEEKTFKDLKDKGDRAEFQKIFWARRDPDLDTPDNEFQAAYKEALAEVNRQFKVGGTAGAATDCGRVYLLLGKPDAMESEPAMAEVPSLRPPETWTFRDRPGQTFTGGEVKIAFERDCRLPQGARLGEQLNRVAESKIAQPGLDYRKGPNGKIVKLADQLPKPTPGHALLKAPRQDFPLSSQNTMMLRSPEGATYVAGLARATGVPREGEAKTANVNVAVQAVDAQGKISAQRDREVTGDFAEDGSLLASYAVTLRPGTYTLNVGVADPRSGKGSVSTVPVEVPDLSEGTLEVMPLVLLRGIQEGAGTTANAKDPLADFVLGPNRLLPVYESVFDKSGELSVIGAVYNAAKDPAGKSSLTWGFTVLKEGKPIAKTEDQVVETDVASPSIGPVPLASFTPGKYTVQLKVKDNVAGKEYTKEAPFEVK